MLAEQFLEYFDGFSIGSNDMTQLALGLDRDSGVVSELFDERNDAVKALLSMAIRAAKKQGKYVGICGQGPSDHEDFAAWLMEEGIDSLSLNPDTVVQTWLGLAETYKFATGPIPGSDAGDFFYRCQAIWCRDARKGKKKPIVGDGQRLHTAIRCFTQGISHVNQGVDL